MEIKNRCSDLDIYILKSATGLCMLENSLYNMSPLFAYIINLNYFSINKVIIE